MKILVNNSYLRSLEKLEKRTKKFSSLYDFTPGDTLGCAFDEDRVRIWYATKYETKQAVYTLKDIKRCEVHANGCLLLFRDKKYIFLPVTNDEENDIELIELCEFLEEELDGLHFFVMERLSFLVDEKTGKRIRVGFSLADSPVIMIVMAVLSIFMATMFVLEKNDFAVVGRSECVYYAGAFVSYDEVHSGYIELDFADGEMLTVHHTCGTAAFLDKMDGLKKGEQLEILVNPNVDYVVEIKSDGQEILSFEASQKAMLKEATWFMWLGVAIYCGAAYLIGYAIYTLIKEKKDEEKRNEPNDEK